MSDDAETTVPSPSETSLPEDTSTPLPSTGEVLGRAVDITLGVAVLLGDTVGQWAKKIQEEAPGVIASLEEKGRPLRERIAAALKDVVPPLREATFAAGSESATEVPTAPTTTGASAVDEISALEARVRELEQQVAASPEADPESETPAESVTVAPGESYTSLADSPYAISETPEEQAEETLLPTEEKPEEVDSPSGGTTRKKKTLKEEP